jgi:hypothetical protein
LKRLLQPHVRSQRPARGDRSRHGGCTRRSDVWNGLEGLENDYQVEAACSPSGVTTGARLGRAGSGPARCAMHSHK